MPDFCTLITNSVSIEYYITRVTFKIRLGYFFYPFSVVFIIIIKQCSYAIIAILSKWTRIYTVRSFVFCSKRFSIFGSSESTRSADTRNLSLFSCATHADVSLYQSIRDVLHANKAASHGWSVRALDRKSAGCW